MWGGNGYWQGSRASSPYTAVPQVGDREANVEWVDPYGDRVAFRLNEANGVDLWVNDDRKVREMTGVRVDGSSLIVDGTGTATTVVGPGKPATWVVMVPLGQDILVTRVMALFQRRSEVTYRGWRSWVPRYRWGLLNWLGLTPSYVPASFTGGSYYDSNGWGNASPRDYRGPSMTSSLFGTMMGYNQPAFNYVPGDVAGAYPSVAEACCMPEAKGVNTGFNYVGETRGSYRQNDQYIYVGEGQGDILYQSRARDCCWCLPRQGKPRDCCWWMSCCLVLSILVVVVLAAMHMAGHWRPVISMHWEPVELPHHYSSYGDATTSFSPTFSILNCTDAIYDKHAHHHWSEERRAWCCKSVGVGCHKTTAEPGFDCADGYHNWVHGWSESKKEWCCHHKNRGCPHHLPHHTALHFDCEAGEHNAERGWSHSKKAWCCHHEDKGCSTTHLPYDCKDHNVWTPGKQAYCCLHHGVDCPETTTTLSPTQEPYDCDAGLGNFAEGWSMAKKMWCCSKTGKGCGTTTGVTVTTTTNYDCMVDPVERWSIAKREWCCERDGISCPAAIAAKPFDCKGDLEHGKLFWTDEKQDWCCKHEDSGCEEKHEEPHALAHGEGGEELTCDLNCFGHGADVVLLEGAIGSGDGAFVSAVTQEQCVDICRRTPDCEAVTFTAEGGGKCYGKKNVHTSECQLGGGKWQMQMLTDVQPWGKCAVFGDPHVVTFDRIMGPSTRQFSQGDYWLVNSPRLSIQGRFGFTHRFPNASSTLGVAVSGPLIMDHKLVVEYVGPEESTERFLDGRRLGGNDGFKVTWDGVELLTDYPSKWESPDKALVATHKAMNPSEYHREGRHTIGGTNEDGSVLPSYLFEFPEADLTVYVLKGPDNCNVVVSMRRLHGGQDGYCGNFNCEVDDDEPEALRQRGLGDEIPEEQSLFGTMPAWRQRQAAIQRELGNHLAAAPGSEHFRPEPSRPRALQLGTAVEEPPDGAPKAEERPAKREDAAALFLQPVSRKPASEREAERIMEAATDPTEPPARRAKDESVDIFS